MLWAHQGAKRACWSAQRGVRHLTQSRGVLDHADPMLQKNRMGNRQHRCIWVTNRAFQQKNRRTGIMRKTGYKILVFTECKQKHILTKSCETLERMLLTYLSCSDFHQLRLNSNPRAPIVAGSQMQYGLRADLQCCVRDSALVVGSFL